MNPAVQWHKLLKPEIINKFGLKIDEHGVLIMANDALLAHVTRIQRHRAAVVQSLPGINNYNSLPEALAQSHFEWHIRTLDLHNVLHSLPKNRKLTILDVGAWNGWLCHQLAMQGHDVTGIDYTADVNDGLGARTHYAHQWRAIQMDVSDLSVFQPIFDIVILNHGLHFSPDPVKTIRQAKGLLRSGGLLILLCVTIHKNPAKRMAQVEAMQQQFRSNYGMDIFVHPTKGYFTRKDKHQIEAQGIKLHRYPQLWKANLKTLLKPTAPAYFRGIYQHDTQSI